jgi:hypothetical protein
MPLNPNGGNGHEERELTLNGPRSGFYVAQKETASVAERLWPWILVIVSIVASLAAMAR